MAFDVGLKTRPRLTEADPLQTTIGAIRANCTRGSASASPASFEGARLMGAACGSGAQDGGRAGGGERQADDREDRQAVEQAVDREGHLATPLLVCGPRP